MNFEQKYEMNTDNNNLSALKIYNLTMMTIYSIALLVCFICNLAVGHTLSWFFIVLSSIAIAFSITNLPTLVKKNRLTISALGTTFFILVLLYVCNAFTHGDWLFRYAYPIAAYPLILAWLVILILQLKKMNWILKTAFLSLISALSFFTISVWVNTVLDGSADSFIHYFLTQFNYNGSNYVINGIFGLCFLLYFFIGVILGVLCPVKKSL